MSRTYLTDENGDARTNSDGQPLFTSDSDGDFHPDTEQTVYADHKNFWGDTTKVDSTFNPSTGKFNK
jgi:hypothetical protein